MDQPAILNFLLQKKKIIIIGVALLVLLSVIVLLSIVNSKKTNKSNFSPSDTSTLPSGKGSSIQNTLPGDSQSSKVIAKVGEELIYQKDFDYIVVTNFAGSQVVQGKTEAEIKSYILNMLTEESLILQNAQKQGLIKLDNTIFNNLNKKLAQRKTTVDNLKKTIQGKTETVTYSRITIWYYNVRPPQIPVDQAQIIAKTKIDKLYADLISNKITIDQAGELIKNDGELAQIDPSYKSNAFFRNTALLDSLPDEIRNVLNTLQSNQYSQVLAFKGNTSAREEYYAVIKLEDKKGSGTFDDWLQNAKQQFLVNYY